MANLYMGICVLLSNGRDELVQISSITVISGWSHRITFFRIDISSPDALLHYVPLDIEFQCFFIDILFLFRLREPNCHIVNASAIIVTAFLLIVMI